MAVFSGDGIGNTIIVDGAYELSELEMLDRLVFPHIDKGAVCLDIGANIGNHSRYFSQRFAQVFAFEPHPRISLLLRANALGTNISPFAFGLSDRSASFPAATDTTNMGGSRIVSDATRADTEYEVKRLDDLIGDLTSERIGFVKIDVEGHEAKALRGAKETLAAEFPPVALEVLPETVQDGSSEPVEVLKEIGYSHFYGLVNTAFWTQIPLKLVRMLVRSSLRLFAPSMVHQLDLKRLDELSPSGYQLLVATKGPLPLKA